MRSRLLLRIGVAALIGLAAPYVDLAVKCREPTSEACVWAKAYMPLTRPVYLVFFGLLTFGTLSLIARLIAGGRAGRIHPPNA